MNALLAGFNEIRRWPQELASARMAAFLSEYALSHAEVDAVSADRVDPSCDELVSRAWREATATGTTLDRYLIHNGLVEADMLYEAFARFLDLPFMAEEFIVPDGLDGASLLAAGHCPIQDDSGGVRYTVAPTGRIFEGLLHAKASGVKIFEGSTVVVTTPRIFAQSVRRRYGLYIAHEANRRMATLAPSLSAENIFGRPTIMVIGPIAALLLLTLAAFPDAWDVISFGMLLYPSFPSIQFKALAIVAAGVYEPKFSEISDLDLPTYSVLVPIYREARIVPLLIERLKRIDYPKAKLEIKMIVEIDDHETQNALICEAMPPFFEIIVCPSGLPRTKPRALNIGLAYAKGDYIVVYDAEDEPDPDQLRKAAAHFASGDPKLGCVQARLAIDNGADSWIARMFAFEYAGLFDGLLPGMSITRQPIPLGGTSNHFRRSLLHNCLGWDAWNVTEDADLGLRLAGLGYHCIVMDSTTWEEAPVDWMAWYNQRTRWLKGWMQTAFVVARNGKRWRRSVSALTRFEIAVISTSSVISALFHPIILLVLGVFLAPPSDSVIRSALHLTLWSFVSVVCIASSILSFAILWVGARRRGLLIRLSDLPYLLLYSLMKTAAAWRALYELISAPTHWHKTEHGLARSSRHPTAQPR